MSAGPEVLAAVDDLLVGKPVAEPQGGGPKLLTMKQAAALLGVSRATIYRLIQRGDLARFELLPGTFRIRRDAIEAFLCN